MTSAAATALVGLILIVLIVLAAVILGAGSRLLAARIAGADRLGAAGAEPAGAPAAGSAEPVGRSATKRPAPPRALSTLDRIALGNSLIARDLRPDDIHPVARTVERAAGQGPIAEHDDRPIQRQDLALLYPTVASHLLR